MSAKVPLRLHIPEPRARPGQAPDFSHLSIPLAGSLRRPAADAPESELRAYPYALIRVLDDDGRAVGEWAPRLDAETLRKGLRDMVLTRVFDERMLKAQRQGKTSFYVKCTGEEAVATGQSSALAPDDMLFPSYRQQGLFIARGASLVDLMCQVFSNSRDRLKGRQLPVMYSGRDLSIFSISGNLGTQVPHAVGWAMASAYRGDFRIAATWVGDGTTAEADFHHGLVFASVYRAPAIINIVNNQWAISTFQGIAGGEQTTFAARAIGYGLPGLRVDGNDFLAVHAATRWAADRARANLGATLIELVTYRAAAHSTSDDPSKYRPADEWAGWPLGDPIGRLKRHLIGLDEWSEQQHADLLRELEDHVTNAAKEAEGYGTVAKPSIEPTTMFEDVFKDMPWHLRRQQAQLREEAP